MDMWSSYSGVSGSADGAAVVLEADGLVHRADVVDLGLRTRRIFVYPSSLPLPISFSLS